MPNGYYNKIICLIKNIQHSFNTYLISLRLITSARGCRIDLSFFPPFVASCYEEQNFALNHVKKILFYFHSIVAWKDFLLADASEVDTSDRSSTKANIFLPILFPPLSSHFLSLSPTSFFLLRSSPNLGPLALSCEYQTSAWLAANAPRGREFLSD